MKSAAFLCDAALVAVLLWWLSASDRSRWWVLAYAWNPLVGLEGAGNGHVDLLGALALVLTAALLARGMRTASAVAFALSIGVKFLPVPLAPLFWGRIRVRDAALAVGIFAALYIPFLGHGQLPLGSLGGYLARWRVNAPVYTALEWIFPTKGPGRGSGRSRICGRALGALAFASRLTGGLGVAFGNDADLRADDFSVVPRLGYPVPFHSTDAAARGLDRELACSVLAASRLGDDGN